MKTCKPIDLDSKLKEYVIKNYDNESMTDKVKAYFSELNQNRSVMSQMAEVQDNIDQLKQDINIITSIASNVTLDAIEKVKSLRPGSALLFGTAFKIPLITQFEIPNPMPTSTNVDIVDRWYNNKGE